jgi:hypothetical protein
MIETGACERKKAGQQESLNGNQMCGLSLTIQLFFRSLEIIEPVAN